MWIYIVQIVLFKCQLCIQKGVFEQKHTQNKVIFEWLMKILWPDTLTEPQFPLGVDSFIFVNSVFVGKL